MHTRIFALVSRAVQSWPGRVILGVIVLATLAIVAFMNPIRGTNSRHDHRPDAHDAALANGWVTNCSGPAFSRFSQGGNGGPGPERPVFKINDQLVLAIPKKNWPSAGKFGLEPPECRQISDLPLAPYLYFVIWGNWSAGYKPEDVPTVYGNKQFRPDVVTVRVDRDNTTKSVEEQREFDQSVWETFQQNAVETLEIGGMACFVPKLRNLINCFGHRTKDDRDVTKLRFLRYSAIPSFVLVQAEYASSQYGRIYVYWSTWTSDPPHLSDIDAAIWKSIEDWDLLNKPATQADAARAQP